MEQLKPWTYVWHTTCMHGAHLVSTIYVDEYKALIVRVSMSVHSAWPWGDWLKAPAALALGQREGSSVQCRGQSKKAETTSTHWQREEGSCDCRGQNKKAATTAAKGQREEGSCDCRGQGKEATLWHNTAKSIAIIGAEPWVQETPAVTAHYVTALCCPCVATNHDQTPLAHSHYPVSCAVQLNLLGIVANNNNKWRILDIS